MLTSDFCEPLRSALLVAVMVSHGCGDSDIGWPCGSTREPLADETASRAGFTVGDVLAWAARTRKIEGAWSEPPAQVRWSPAAGPVDVEFALARRAGMAEQLSGCAQDAVAIPVTLAVRTSDGSLREELAAELVALSENSARIRVETSFRKLSGSLEVGSNENGFELVQPYFEANLAPCGWFGVFSAVFQKTTSDSVSDLPMPAMLRFASTEDGCALPPP